MRTNQKKHRKIYNYRKYTTWHDIDHIHVRAQCVKTMGILELIAYKTVQFTTEDQRYLSTQIFANV